VAGPVRNRGKPLSDDPGEELGTEVQCGAGDGTFEPRCGECEPNITRLEASRAGLGVPNHHPNRRLSLGHEPPVRDDGAEPRDLVHGLGIVVVDFTANTVQVFREKTGRDDILLMTERVQDILKRSGENKGDQKYVFTDKDGGPLKYRAEALNCAYQRAGLDVTGCHVLRHTHASRLAQAGVSLYKISRALGRRLPEHDHLCPCLSG
jgi:hypothetical protein